MLFQQSSGKVDAISVIINVSFLVGIRSKVKGDVFAVAFHGFHIQWELYRQTAFGDAAPMMRSRSA